MLRWAARLHETGLDIAHSKYHRHSAYLLEHADMPGFPREEQLLLAALVGGHRRQLSVESLEDLLPPWDRLAEFLIVILRLAVLLHRGRSPQPLPEVQLTVKSRNVTLELPQRWIKEHPLTLEDLEQERAYLKEAGFRLSIVWSPVRVLRRLAVGQGHPLVVQIHQPGLRGEFLLARGTGVLPVSVQCPGLHVVFQVQFQIIRDPRFSSASSIGKAISIRRNKLRSIQSALPQYTSCAPAFSK